MNDTPRKSYPGDQLGTLLKILAGILLVLGLVGSLATARTDAGILSAVLTTLVGAGALAALGVICQNLAAIRRGLAGWDRIMQENQSGKGE